MDSNTLYTTDIELWKLVTIAVALVVAEDLCCGQLEVNFWRISKWKTHIARALAASGSSTDLGSGNDIAKSVGTLCVGDDCEVHVVKSCTNGAGTCEM